MLRILTYNVRRCLGSDGQVSTDRIASVIAAARPDIVALQELDVNRRRTGAVDQAEQIAQAVEMKMLFHPALTVEEERYGDAVLSALPMELMKAAALPGRGRAEPRGALWVRVRTAAGDIQIVNTHLGLRSAERLAQIDALLGPDWLAHPACREPRLLIGDFNAVPRSRAYRRLARTMDDIQARSGNRPRPTFPSRFPVLRIDHIFASPGIRVLRTETLRTPLTRIASDHLPLLAEIRIEPTERRRPWPAAAAAA